MEYLARLISIIIRIVAYDVLLKKFNRRIILFLALQPTILVSLRNTGISGTAIWGPSFIRLRYRDIKNDEKPEANFGKG